MKKYLIAAGVATLAITMVAVAASYSFNTNLTVGSTGPDVVALQQALMGMGYSIPALSSGAAQPGYFGSQTKTAVMKYQSEHSIPNTGFVGPLTRGSLNSGTSVATTPSSTFTCPVGYTCTANPGTVTTPGQTTTPVSTQTGITTPGVPGIMSVTSGPISSSVLNVGQQNAPVMTVRITAQYSDIDVQSLTVDLGPNTAIYNKVFNSLMVTDGTNVLATQALNSSTVVQSGSDYVVGIAGFHFIVPKGTYKDLVIKANLNTSIDSSYVAGGSNVPGTVSIAGGTNNLTGWGVAVAANSLRGVDGAGLNLYGPTTAIVQALTINKSLVDNAQANVSLDPASPLVSAVPVTDTTNNQYLGLPVLTFDVNAQNDTLHLHEVKVHIYTSGTGSVGAAYLYQGSTQITSASISGGVADFTNITDGTNGASIPVNTTVPFTVKVDATGVSSATDPLIITTGVATSSSSDLVVYNSIDGNAKISGSATGNQQTVLNSGPAMSLAGAPTITMTDITPGGASVTTHKYTATFNLNIQAVGGPVMIGLPASTTAAGASFGTTSTGINLAQAYDNSTASSTIALVANYSQPSNTTLSADGTSFTISQNQSVSLPVQYSFTTTNVGDNYAVQMQGVNTVSNGAALFLNFMKNQTAWRTPSI
ncbi:peptidoglycan-binding protein [Patescibacteria group bacterium]|nr:peptidoglycan-binding protein [Patescibacteria group bacterium]